MGIIFVHSPCGKGNGAVHSHHRIDTYLQPPVVSIEMTCRVKNGFLFARDADLQGALILVGRA